MDDTEEPSPSLPWTKSSPSAGFHQTLDKALRDLGAQWSLDPGRAASKREQLGLLLFEVGSKRFRRAIDHTIHTYHGEFFPTIAMIRGNVPRADKSQLCGKCECGWIVAYFTADGLPRMRRCECRGGPEADRRISQGEWQA